MTSDLLPFQRANSREHPRGIFGVPRHTRFVYAAHMKLLRYLDAAGHTCHGARCDDGSVRRIDGDLLGAWRVTDMPARIGQLLAPIQPAAIFCVGLNYRRHAEETHATIPTWPVLFMKSPAAVQHPDAPITLPTHLASHKVDFEAELVVVIGRACKNVPRERALDYVLGYTCGNDVSARDWQKEYGGGQWCRAKTFDTFAPLGPCLVTPDEIPNPNALGIRCVLNGATVQASNTADMIFDVPTLIAFLSGSTTLPPGSVIFTGTPAGVGMARQPPLWLKPGDTVTVSIDGIGDLTNPVIAEAH